MTDDLIVLLKIFLPCKSLLMYGAKIKLIQVYN